MLVLLLHSLRWPVCLGAMGSGLGPCHLSGTVFVHSWAEVSWSVLCLAMGGAQEH